MTASASKAATRVLLATVPLCLIGTAGAVNVPHDRLEESATKLPTNGDDPLAVCCRTRFFDTAVARAGLPQRTGIMRRTDFLERRTGGIRLRRRCT